MRLPFLVTVVSMIVGGFSGCVEEEKAEAFCPETPGSAAVELGAITPGKWVVNGPTDYLMLWAHNAGNGTIDVQWSLCFIKDSPDGLTFSFDPPRSTLQPNGTKHLNPQTGRYEYPDWAWTRARVTAERTSPPGIYSGGILGGGAQESLQVLVTNTRVVVTEPTDKVKVDYRGRFQDTMQEFDSGQFQTTLGSGETVDGFDNGLMGLALTESAQLVIPPALAYGYDQGSEFDGRWLVFDVKILQIMN